MNSYQIVIRDLEMLACVGVHAWEEHAPQPVRFNITLSACRGGHGLGVVDYCVIADGIRRITTCRHIGLVEDLAEEIAAFCLSDTRVTGVRIRVEKLTAVEGAAAVGIEMQRYADR